MGLHTGDHTTVLDASFESRRRSTWPGMAHFARTGTPGKTCRECVFWGPTHYNSYAVGTGVLKPHLCGKAARLMPGVEQKAVPHYASSCKYYEFKDGAPPIEKPKDWGHAGR